MIFLFHGQAGNWKERWFFVSRFKKNASGRSTNHKLLFGITHTGEEKNLFATSANSTRPKFLDFAGRSMFLLHFWTAGEDSLTSFSEVIVLPLILMKSFLLFCQCLDAALISFPSVCLASKRFCFWVDLKTIGQWLTLLDWFNLFEFTTSAMTRNGTNSAPQHLRESQLYQLRSYDVIS